MLHTKEFSILKQDDMSLWGDLLESCRFATLQIDHEHSMCQKPFQQHYTELLLSFQVAHYFKFTFCNGPEEHKAIFPIWTEALNHLNALSQVTHFHFKWIGGSAQANGLELAFFEWLEHHRRIAKPEESFYRAQPFVFCQ